MGLFDKLFGGDKKAEKSALDFLKALAGNGKSEQKPQSNAQPEKKPEPQPVRQTAYESDDPYENIPAEENQYTFKGSYIEYFAHIFREDFPEYRAEYERPDERRTVFTLYKGGAKALVVELLTEKSSVKKLRKQCQNEGTPYLRFYYDHDGWWNTRSYVTERTRRALNA